jgi:glucose/arabinose dehydrogenase
MPKRPLLKIASVLIPLVLTLAAIGCQAPPQAMDSAPTALAPIRSTAGVITPAGVFVERFSHGLFAPAGLALGSDGALYVAGQAADGAGQIVRLANIDSGQPEGQVEVVATGLSSPRGLVWWSPPGQPPLLLVAVREGLAAVVDGQMRLAGQFAGAGRANDVAVGSDGRIYVAEGASDIGAPQPGAVWRFDPPALLADGAPAQGELFVSGLRSASGITFSPSGAIYVTDSGQGWPPRPDVPDELNVLLGGGDYGWPRVWGQPPPNSGSIGPMALFPAGADASGVLFYSGRMFEENAADLLVALPGQGKVVRVEIVSDAAGYHSTIHDFITGLQRPVALVEGPRGDLYVADAEASAVYRIWR